MSQNRKAKPDTRPAKGDGAGSVYDSSSLDSVRCRASEILAISVISRLNEHGFEAYLVGGCVRDRLLGLKAKDFDISTGATPSEVLNIFLGSQTVGAKFGVVLVADSVGAQVEVATFRSETTYSDGRRPDAVQFQTDPALDARRRDFTINALMQNPFSGQVFDYVGGQADLEKGIIRAIGAPDARFEEDHLRMLRAVRFAARFDFEIEAATLAAIRQFAPAICKVSVERIREELVRLLTEGGARRGLELLDRCGLLEHILPEVKAFQGVPQPPEYHPEGDVWNHVLIMLDKMERSTPTLAMAALFHDVGKPPTFRIASRIRFDGHAEVGAAMTRGRLTHLRFSNEEIEHITALVANHMRFKDVRQMRLSTLKRFLRLPHFEEHLELHRLDCLASNGYTDAYEFVQSKLAELDESDLKPPRLITGHDLIDAGYHPGPGFSRALEAIETAQLDRSIQTKDQAMLIARAVLDTSS